MVVAHTYPSGRKKHGLLRIARPESWPAEVSAEHREYLAQLIGDWERTPDFHLPLLFEQLCQLSIGPLHTAGEGHCRPEEVEAIASGFLKAIKSP